jgi:hypothetical protein
MILEALAALASPAAQSEVSWTVARTPTAISAEISLSGGDRVEARCEAGTVSLQLTDHGRLPSRSRSVRADADGTEPVGEWLRWEETGPLLSRNPAVSIRGLLGLRQYRVRFMTIPSGPPTAVEGDLPADDGPLREVLGACNEPLQSDRDYASAEVRERMLSLRPGEYPIVPRVPAEFPRTALDQGIERGTATISCVMEDRTTVRDCRVESEFPAGAGFGAAALAAYSRARLDRGVPGAIFIQNVVFAVVD